MSRSVHENLKSNNIWNDSQNNLVHLFNNVPESKLNFESTIFSKHAKWYAPTKYWFEYN